MLDLCRLQTRICHLPRWRGFSKGLLHDLMPDQWLDTCNTFESCNAVDHPQLGQGWDVFGDESIVMFSFPGHAAGQHGALIQTSNHGPVLLAADAIWNLKAITEGRTPHPIVRLFFDDWKAYHRTLDKLRAFHAAHPEVPVLGTHCPTTYRWVKALAHHEVALQTSRFSPLLGFEGERRQFEKDPLPIKNGCGGGLAKPLCLAPHFTVIELRARSPISRSRES